MPRAERERRVEDWLPRGEFLQERCSISRAIGRHRAQCRVCRQSAQEGETPLETGRRYERDRLLRLLVWQLPADEPLPSQAADWQRLRRQSARRSLLRRAGATGCECALSARSRFAAARPRRPIPCCFADTWLQYAM